MANGFLIAVVLAGVLACPLMMFLGRRGIGPGCAMMGCKPRRNADETIEMLRARHEELSQQITEFESARRQASVSAESP